MEKFLLLWQLKIVSETPQNVPLCLLDKKADAGNSNAYGTGLVVRVSAEGLSPHELRPSSQLAVPLQGSKFTFVSPGATIIHLVWLPKVYFELVAKPNLFAQLNPSK